ncbi:S66 peptidase family protein [Halosegnis sp.]|uniref:S66 family peptidase n=1 Tax=Halosegnis sp. TaxID=2864959 RepID=UPI0035D4E0C3
MRVTTPPALSPGDRVAIVGPSSGGARDAPHVFRLGLRRLRERFDLEPVVYPTARQSTAFLEANPRARAADIHAAFQDPTITGVIATIGGHDQLRILRHLDADILRANPTRFYGMSDNTNLNLFLWRAGLVSYNGAQLMNELAVPGALPAYTARYCRRAFFEERLGELAPANRWTDEPSTWWTGPSAMDTEPTYEPNPGRRWAGGETAVEGRLWGGCRAILAWQLATDRYLPAPRALDGAILCLETAEDIPAPAEVGATLMCLGERGLLARFAGVLVGRPPTRSFVTEPPRDERHAYRERLYETVIDQVSRYNPDAPVVLGVDWGHTTPVAPLPIGGRIRLTPATDTIVCQ